jgi:hypothetical protein
MAEKSAKKKPKKAAKTSSDPSVLGSLRSTRPTRLGGDRRGAARPARAASTTTATAAKQAAATKPRAAKSKPAAKRKTVKPKVRPQPTPPAAPPAGWQVPGDGDARRDSGPTGLLTTAVQAAGELAQLGISVGGQLLKRLPHP